MFFKVNPNSTCGQYCSRVMVIFMVRLIMNNYSTDAKTPFSTTLENKTIYQIHHYKKMSCDIPMIFQKWMI